MNSQKKMAESLCAKGKERTFARAKEMRLRFSCDVRTNDTVTYKYETILFPPSRLCRLR